MEYQLPMVIEQPKLPVIWKKKRVWKIKEFVQLYREPMVTYSITPNNSPEVSDAFSFRRRNMKAMDWGEQVHEKAMKSDMLLNTISGLFSRFYAPERVRLLKDGIKVKLNDVVSYKVAIINGEMKFYLTVPKKWGKSFCSAIRKDWGEVDITKVGEKVVDFNPKKAKAMEVHMRHHYALSMKYEKNDDDSFYSSIASIASILGEKDKLLIDYNIKPVNGKWKEKANKKMKQFKEGKVPSREDALTLTGILWRTVDMFSVIVDEFVRMLEDVMGAEGKKDRKDEALFSLNYSDRKLHANTKGYEMQIRVLGEGEEKIIKHAFRNVENSFGLLDGDNKFSVTHIKTKRGIKSIINAVENNSPQMLKTKDVYFDKEMSNFLKMPQKQTLKEYKDVIQQDNFTRTSINPDFFNASNGAIPFARSLEKVERPIYFGGYERDWWTDKGRYVKDRTRLDDRCMTTMVFGKQGSGKTSLSETQALYTFGAHITDKEQWKRESKSVVVFDVADGAMIKNIYNHCQPWQRDRVVVLNHANHKNPIAVNNADLEEFNREVMDDEDYAFTLAEMEAKLALEVLQSEKTMAMDRWFRSALQVVHMIDKDWGYIEAIKVLIDEKFRKGIIDKIPNKRLQLEIKTYHKMDANGQTKKIVETIQNRFSQLESDQKLWDCIAQKPVRDEDGKVKLNFRKMMDGDEDGAYMILIYIPKTGITELYRKFIFAHYFTKVWNVALSREVGFADREYRPETLVVIDEIHQIVGIPLIGKLFIDLFKEPRKYSLRLLLTLHGWSSLATAGRSVESDIKQSIMDNGCNLIMLKGGDEAFESLSNFLQPMTVADFTNLMNMDFCGIFGIAWKNKNHVFQAKLGWHLEKNKDFQKHSNVDSNFLVQYASPYGRNKDEVREDTLNRSFDMIEASIENSFGEEKDDGEWQELKEVGMREKKSKK